MRLPVIYSGFRRVRDLARQYLVDTPAVEIDDLEKPAFRLDAIADIEYRAELLQQETGQGLVLPRRRQGDLEQRRELDGRHPAQDQIRAVAGLHPNAGIFSSAKPAIEIRRLLVSNHDKAVA